VQFSLWYEKVRCVVKLFAVDFRLRLNNNLSCKHVEFPPTDTTELVLQETLPESRTASVAVTDCLSIVLLSERDARYRRLRSNI
jgi:hypothetical protein